MHKSEKRIVISEVIAGICFIGLFFLMFWGHAQLIDPQSLFLITKVPSEVAIAISIIIIIGTLVSEKIASNKEQTTKQIKKGKIVQWTF